MEELKTRWIKHLMSSHRILQSYEAEGREINRFYGDRYRSLFLDICPSHGLNDEVSEALKIINTMGYKLPSNATDVVQPADYFKIKKSKEVWRRRWDEYKMDLVRRGLWTDSDNGNGSGRLVNQGKRFFLKHTADYVREVNLSRTVAVFHMPERIWL